MKVFFVAVFVALIVYVSCEACGNTQDCVTHGITNCGGGTHVVCSNHQCQCLQQGGSGQSCVGRDDCPDCSQGNDKHCVDGTCRCTDNDQNR